MTIMRPLKTSLNLFSCSSWLNSVGWKSEIFEYEEESVHLEYENHPGDAEGDEGALDEGEDPHLNKFHDCCHRFVWGAKGLREDEGAALKIYLASNSIEKMKD